MLKKLWKYIKRILIIALIAGGIWCIANLSLVLYGIDQLSGQLHIINNTRPIKEILDDKLVADSVKKKLLFIESIKKYAIDSLGLKESKNYTTFFDQKGKPLLWVLTACDPFSIKAYHWKFPLLGAVSYKGFFDFDKGKDEQVYMMEQGFDTDYDDVSAWSTLGWFKDPVLSGMLRRSEGQLAELIIHEMTHSTLYLKSSVDINENLASVCGEQGAIRFLSSTFGNDSPQLRDYIDRKDDYDMFSRHMLEGTRKLDSLYSSIKDSIVVLKMKMKKKMIEEIVKSIDTVSFHHPKRYSALFRDQLPNNTYFLNFVRYDSRKDAMKRELTYEFHGNIKAFIDHLRETNGEKYSGN